jgi:pimeloyl-ACP methyl ester carboxylesterase
VIVLVHGLWHGAWSWDRVRSELASRGVDSVAVELPMTSLDDDVAAVVAVLDETDGPVLLAAHSYGGAVITAAGHPSVGGLVYVAAFQLDVGESISRACPDVDVAPTALSGALRFSADGAWVSLDPTAGRALLYGQAPDDDATRALARMRPAARSLFSARAPSAAWRKVPSVYAVCAQDRCVAPQLQTAMARRATRRVRWPSDHSPHVSHPELVAALLAEESGRIR